LRDAKPLWEMINRAGGRVWLRSESERRKALAMDGSGGMYEVIVRRFIIWGCQPVVEQLNDKGR
jgi:hypothetical protein